MVFSFACFLLPGCAPDERPGGAENGAAFGGTVPGFRKTPGARSEYVLGTFCRIDLFDEGRPELYDRLFARLAELDRILSANREDSELAAVNRDAGKEAIRVTPELYTVLERALYFAEASGGAFDPTVGPLVKLWDIGGRSGGGVDDADDGADYGGDYGGPQIPPAGEIAAALALVNWRDVELLPLPAGARDSDNFRGGAFLGRSGMSLDLGAIAKGYAADELVRILNEAGIRRALIDLGGNIYIWGNKDDGQPWRVGIQNPLDERGSYVGILETESASVVTSGIYERYFTGADGKRYHHILSTGRTASGDRESPAEPSASPGYPVENGILSVTIIAASSMDADALSTSCFALGYEQGRVLAEANGAKAIFIFADKTIRGSKDALAAFTVTDKAYRKEL
jgi:thiamine biosynthesis lipoprotein